MSEQITIEVPDQVVRHATQVAAQTRRRVEQVLVSWLERTVAEVPVEELPDQEVLALTELQLAPEQQTALSDLLGRSREGRLETEGQRRLDALMQRYERGLLRKSQALREAVQRGLRGPLAP